MYKVILILIVFACMAGCGDCNREVKDVPYCGDATAVDPYLEVIGLHIDSGDCDQMGCTYFMYGSVWLHNPLSVEYNTDIKCEFWDDNYLIGDSTRSDVTIRADRSKEFEFREQYTTPDPTQLIFQCDLE